LDPNLRNDITFYAVSLNLDLPEIDVNERSSNGEDSNFSVKRNIIKDLTEEERRSVVHSYLRSQSNKKHVEVVANNQKGKSFIGIRSPKQIKR
jgi:hypothetical protein